MKEASTVLDMEHGRFPYSPIVDRPPLRWPNGAYVAVWIAPNIEYFHFDEPFAGGRPTTPDVPSYAVRDYGNRVAIWRMMPPSGDDHLAERLARLSAEVYGRDALDVELDLQSAMERIRGPQRPSESDKTDESAKLPDPPAPNNGTPTATGVVVGAEVPGA